MISVVTTTKIVAQDIDQIDSVVDFAGRRMRDLSKCILQSLSWPGQGL